MKTRNKLLVLVLAIMATALIAGTAMAVQGTPLPGNKIPQFVDPLPLLSVAGGPIETVVASTGEITLNMLEFRANIMPSTFVPANGLPYTGTWVLGYRVGPTTAPTNAVGTYIGPVIVATRHVPTQIRYVNNLTANNIAWRDWIDQSLHWANPGNAPMMVNGMGNPDKYMGPVPAVPHLHGAEDPAVIDGGPEAWFLSNESIPGTWTAHGSAYYAGTDWAGLGANPAAANEAIYRYPNGQEAAPLWFHDHLLGATRINANIAGLAGAYALIDPGLALPTGLHPVGLQQGATGAVNFTVPLVLQDRMFDTNGQTYFPNVGINPEHPYWVPEFVGDTIVVNGKVWPYMNVHQQRYRFFLIDGSSSRPYDMFLQDLTSKVKGPRMWVIATEGGYLDSPVLIDPNATVQQVKAGVQKSLLIMPGERYEIIVDFADPVWKALLPKKATFPMNLILRNTAPTVDGNPKASTEGRIMQFRVSDNAPVDTSYDPASGIPIRSNGQTIKRLVTTATGSLTVTPDKTRELVLVEIEGPGGPLEVLVNNTKWTGLRSDGTTTIPGSTFVLGNWLTELPTEGDTEVWEIVNTTADAHPIHLHAVQFQLMNRQAYDTEAFGEAYEAAFPGGDFIPAYGPPLSYDPSLASGFKYGGNPDVSPYLLGLPMPQLAHEVGWKDTVIMPSGSVTRIAVRFAPQDVNVGTVGSFTFNPSASDGAYVWHCHITDHEDNEMMRPYQILPNIPDASRTYVQGVDY